MDFLNHLFKEEMRKLTSNYAPYPTPKIRRVLRVPKFEERETIIRHIISGKVL